MTNYACSLYLFINSPTLIFPWCLYYLHCDYLNFCLEIASFARGELSKSMIDQRVLHSGNTCPAWVKSPCTKQPEIIHFTYLLYFGARMLNLLQLICNWNSLRFLINSKANINLKTRIPVFVQVFDTEYSHVIY